VQWLTVNLRAELRLLLLLCLSLSADCFVCELAAGVDPAFLRTYWPLILVFVGLGKMWTPRARGTIRTAQRDQAFRWERRSAALAFVLVLVFCSGTAAPSPAIARYSNDLQHQSRTVDRGRKSVNVFSKPAPANQYSSGSSHLLDADFNYSDSYETPRVDYNVADGVGHLSISQDNQGTHSARRNQWNCVSVTMCRSS